MVHSVYFEDVEVGDSIAFGPLTITRDEVVAFAAQFDPQPFHLSDEAAADTHFGSLAASGWHTTALFMKMFVAEMQHQPAYQAASLGAMGVDELRWLHPVRPGDVLRVRATVIEARRSQSRPDRGLVRTKVEALNQNDQVVMSMVAMNLFRCRNPG